MKQLKLGLDLRSGIMFETKPLSGSHQSYSTLLFQATVHNNIFPGVGMAELIVLEHNLPEDIFSLLAQEEEEYFV